MHDPLKIYYVVVLGDETPEDASPFQGFARGWRHVDWALLALATLPADVLECVAPLDPLISQRMGGGRPLSWIPLSIGALEQLSAADFQMFLVLFTGTGEVAERAEKWRAAQASPVLHVSNSDTPDVTKAEALTEAVVIDHCRSVMAVRGAELDDGRHKAADEALSSWKPRDREAIALKAWGHNLALPNHMTLLRSARALSNGEPFVGKSEADFDALILDGTRAVMALREKAGLRNFHRMLLVHPELYLAEPALFRHAYQALPNGSSDAAARLLRSLQTQSSFLIESREDFSKQLDSSGHARALLATRLAELQTFTIGVGLTAAQTASAVMRLSPGVNRVFPALSSFARSIRSESRESRHKSLRLFTSIQSQLRQAVGKERMAFLEREITGPIKIVSDAPIEWLPIGPLPLHIRHQCSRINATPGNLMLALLSKTDVVTVTPEHLQDVLVVSAFTATDKLRNTMTGVLERLRPRWEGKVNVSFARAATIKAFVDILNNFNGGILVFDGHGEGDADDGIGKLRVADECLDVWSLRGKVRVPPIVILSACDTQSIDAASHATVGNGFLALGATAVVATLLPVGGWNSAHFIGRLVYRLADFLTAALAPKQRVLNWTEVVTGMQRMFLASEILDELVSPPAPLESPRGKIQARTNMDINGYNMNWFEELVSRIAEHRNEEYSATEKRASRVIARSEAIRYIQLGHPENILIDNGSIYEEIVPQVV